MGKGLTGLALLLAGALAWAYLLTHPFGEAPPAGLVRVWKVEPRAISKITYREGKMAVELEPSWADGEAPFIWMRTERERKPLPHRGPKPPPKPQEQDDQPQVVKSAFKGNKRAGSTLEDFAELLATRAVGGEEAAKTPAFGLAEPSGTLRVELKGDAAPLELRLGALTYGKQMRYAVTGKDQQVFLFQQALFSRLARATTSLMDRELLPFSIEEAVHVKIVREGQEREFWRREGGVEEDGIWGVAPDAAEGDPTVDALITSLTRLKAVAFLTEPGEQEAESEVAALEVRAYAGAEAAEPAWLRLFPDAKQGMIARSSHTRSRVRVSQRAGQAVVKAADRVMKRAAEPAASPDDGG